MEVRLRLKTLWDDDKHVSPHTILQTSSYAGEHVAKSVKLANLHEEDSLTHSKIFLRQMNTGVSPKEFSGQSGKK